MIATIRLEDYAAGVLAGEAANLKSGPALQAMAIVARTWALRWRGRHRSEGFDFCPLTHCQVFRPGSERSREGPPALAAAARATQGRVLKYGDQIVDPYFTANCGGRTEAAGDIWPDRSAPYLRSVVDHYCAGSEHSSWQRTLSLETVETILRENVGISLQGPLQDFAVETRDSSGRAQVLRALASSTLMIDANQFRYAVDRRLGWNTLMSNLYECERSGDLLVFTGRGLGHGVGLCQAGAEQMGRMGLPCQTILATYFPGAVIASLAPQESDPVASSEHFELAYPPSQQPWVGEALEALETFRRELRQRGYVLPEKVHVETWETTEQFTRATGRPGWAAAGNDGQSISLQPLRTLHRKRILRSTLRHELMHLVVHSLRSPQVPQWFEEGLVIYLTGERIVAPGESPSKSRNLEERVSNPRSEAEMRFGYARALERVRALARQRGKSGLWQILEHPTRDDLRWLHETGGAGVALRPQYLW